MPSRRALLALPLLLLPAARAQTVVASPAAVAAFDGEVQTVWDRLRPALEDSLRAEAAARLPGLTQGSGSWEVEVTALRAARFELGPAPGLLALASDRLEIGAPAQGVWGLELELDAIVRKPQGWWRPSFRLSGVRVRARDVRASALALLDDADPARPVVRRADPPRIDLRLELRGGGLFSDLLLRLLSPLADRLARRAVSDALQGLAPQLGQLQGLPGPVPGAGAPLYADSGQPVPWNAVVEGVEAKLRRDHLPHGTLLHARMSLPSTGSWLDDYGPGGPGNVGVAAPDGDGGDSAIWTGHYLAAEACRWSVTRDPRALEAARHAVSGLSALLEIHGDTGLLARVAAPEASPMGQRIAAGGSPLRRFLRGEPWVGDAGGNGVSRDQYMGAFLGLSLAHDLIADPALQAECGRLLERMLDYLIAHAWFVDQDRPPFLGAAGGGFPTFWAGIPDQKIHTLLIGRSVAPGKYDAELARWSPIAETSWLANWTSCFNLESYYKFNLSHGTLWNAHRLETDPARWRHLARGALVLRRYVGHHRNPHFELVHASLDPAVAPAYRASAREGLRRFLRRPHRHVAPALVDLSGVSWVTFPVPSLTLPGQNPPPATITIPSEPLDPALRPPAGDFLWQRWPFEPAQAGQGDPLEEQAGIDLTLPYWAGRWQGAW